MIRSEDKIEGEQGLEVEIKIKANHRTEEREENQESHES